MTIGVGWPTSTNLRQKAETPTRVKTRNQGIGPRLPNNGSILQLPQNLSHFPLCRLDNEIRVIAAIFHRNMWSLPQVSDRYLPSYQSHQHHAANNSNVHAGTQFCDAGNEISSNGWVNLTICPKTYAILFTWHVLAYTYLKTSVPTSLGVSSKGACVIRLCTISKHGRQFTNSPTSKHSQAAISATTIPLPHLCSWILMSHV